MAQYRKDLVAMSSLGLLLLATLAHCSCGLGLLLGLTLCPLRWASSLLCPPPWLAALQGTERFGLKHLPSSRVRSHSLFGRPLRPWHRRCSGFHSAQLRLDPLPIQMRLGIPPGRCLRSATPILFRALMVCLFLQRWPYRQIVSQLYESWM